jgi:hypothetical protein
MSQKTKRRWQGLADYSESNWDVMLLEPLTLVGFSQIKKIWKIWMSKRPVETPFWFGDKRH